MVRDIVKDFQEIFYKSHDYNHLRLGRLNKTCFVCKVSYFERKLIQLNNTKGKMLIRDLKQVLDLDLLKYLEESFLV